MGFGGLHNRGDILNAGDQVTAARLVKRRRGKNRLDNGGHGLIDVKRGVVLPAAIQVEFPMHARKRGTNQAIVHLLRNAPLGRILLLPASFEARQISALVSNRFGGPGLLQPSGALEARNVIAIERLPLSAPTPEAD